MFTNTVMKKLYLLFALIIAFALIVACDSANSEGNASNLQVISPPGVTHYEIVTTHFENYAYRNENIPLPLADFIIQAMNTRGGNVYYAYFTIYPRDRAVSLIRVDADGSGVEHVGYFDVPGFDIIAFEFLDDGNLAFFTTSRELSSAGNLFVISGYYREVTLEGTTLFSRNFEEIITLNPENAGFNVDAVFSGDGTVALTFWNGSVNELLLLCLEDGEIAELLFSAHHFGNTIASTGEGRVFVLDSYGGNAVLREVDFDSGSFGDAYIIHGGSVSDLRLHRAGAYAGFDLFINDGTNLFSYNFERGEQETLLNFMQAGITGLVAFDTNIGSLDGGRFAILTGSFGNQYWEPSLHILSPVPREEVPERTIITLSGLTISEEILIAVNEFNSRSLTHQIDAYAFFDGIFYGDQESWDIRLEQATTRFNTAIIAGNVPDIVVSPTQEMFDRGYLLDLAPLIEADPDINRSDFIPSAFESLIQHDGTIPLVSEGFVIITMIGREGTIGGAEAWTLSELLRLTEQVQDLSIPFGYNFMREDILSLMISSPDMGFIDRTNFEVNFENQEFIDLIHTAKLLPARADSDPDAHDWVFDTIGRINRRENILASVAISNLDYIQYYFDFIDDLVFLGLPGTDGGIHYINAGFIGISAISEHSDYAWKFVREKLLSTATVNEWSIPIRIDLFEDRIAEAMTPRTVEDNYGEVHELPRETMFSAWAPMQLYAMTEETADRLREIIDSAVPAEWGVDEGLMELIKSDLADFFAGARSAEDTARIIQSRASIWISEQELLFS